MFCSVCLGNEAVFIYPALNSGPYNFALEILYCLVIQGCFRWVNLLYQEHLLEGTGLHTCSPASSPDTSLPVFRVLETESDSQCHPVFCPCLRTSTSADVGVRVQVTGTWGEDKSKQPGKSAKGDIIQRDWAEREDGANRTEQVTGSEQRASRRMGEAGLCAVCREGAVGGVGLGRPGCGLAESRNHRRKRHSRCRSLGWGRGGL